ncbi:D-tyrosyl-tRNA(Tyr) deacylase [Nocardioidaceae bacterium]|nr:D-tyrosyl-tRNA(Tyr) deacylase [Nocardioidaceae bacterium]
MRAVVQRVSEASVTVDGDVVGEIAEPGLVVLLGVTHDDGADQVAWMVRKISELKLLREEQSLLEASAPVLVVSQFTLYADVKKGRKPSWSKAAPGAVSEPLYEAVCDGLEGVGLHVARGVFGADMAVSLVNDGPVTLVLETP